MQIKIIGVDNTNLEPTNQSLIKLPIVIELPNKIWSKGPSFPGCFWLDIIGVLNIKLNIPKMAIIIEKVCFDSQIIGLFSIVLLIVEPMFQLTLTLACTGTDVQILFMSFVVLKLCETVIKYWLGCTNLSTNKYSLQMG